jgi:hypothetical protein
MPPDFPGKPASSVFRVEEQSHLEKNGTWYGARRIEPDAWEMLAIRKVLLLELIEQTL